MTAGLKNNGSPLFSFWWNECQQKRKYELEKEPPKLTLTLNFQWMSKIVWIECSSKMEEEESLLERQENEVEALKAIYDNDFEVCFETTS